ncbi:MAG: cupin domain-containing protein [Thermoleophilia bacterium]
MKMFDLTDMEAYGYGQRSKNVFHEAPEFKMRVIDLAPGGSIPLCEMTAHVVFVCVAGEALVTVEGDEVSLKPTQGLVTGPATMSMRSPNGAKLLGIQITAAEGA